MARTCDIPGCDRPHLAKGLCLRHYHAQRRTPNLTGGTCKRCGNPTGNPDGRKWYCADCVVAQLRDKHTRERELGLYKRPRKPCAGCGGEKGPGERRRYCDACQKAIDEGKPPERVAKTEAERREIKRQRANEWYYAHRDEVLAAAREFRANNPEWAAQANTRAKAWVEAHPERAAELRYIRVNRYQSKKLDLYVEDVDPLLVLERNDGVCGICGEDVNPLEFQVDHIIPISRGGEHSYANTQPAHPKCNKTKGAKIPSQTFDSWGEKVPVTEYSQSEMGPKNAQ